MPALSRLITFLPVLALLGPMQASHAQETSPWTEGHRSRVRLVAGGADGAGQIAGVEISLDPGFKTYWRNPGEAGLPPAFDWSKSTNVGAIEVLWPAPTRSEDAGGVSYGYQGQVLFPVRIRPQDPGKPVGLGLKIDYGVCKDICIPAQAELSLKLPASPSPSTRGQIEGALSRIPRPKPLKAEGDLAVLAVEPAALDGKPRLAVTVRAPAGSKPTLFVEGPDNWFLLAAEKPVSALDNAASQLFWVEVLERPRDAAGPVDLRFTLVAGDKAIETTSSLDAARLER
jgi:DsbC/DsbD-like thiol-disulfide interchange protein